MSTTDNFLQIRIDRHLLCLFGEWANEGERRMINTTHNEWHESTNTIRMLHLLSIIVCLVAWKQPAVAAAAATAVVHMHTHLYTHMFDGPSTVSFFSMIFRKFLFATIPPSLLLSLSLSVLSNYTIFFAPVNVQCASLPSLELRNKLQLLVCLVVKISKNVEKNSIILWFILCFSALDFSNKVKGEFILHRISSFAIVHTTMSNFVL